MLCKNKDYVIIVLCVYVYICIYYVSFDVRRNVGEVTGFALILLTYISKNVFSIRVATKIKV